MSFLFLLFLSKIANKSQMCSEQLNAQREREGEQMYDIVLPDFLLDGPFRDAMIVTLPI